MGFRKDEIRIFSDVTDEEAAGFVVYNCPACNHPDLFHPEMVGPEGENIWCAECGQDFGSWPELYDKIFTAGAMLDAVLAKRPR